MDGSLGEISSEEVVSCWRVLGGSAVRFMAIEYGGSAMLLSWSLISVRWLGSLLAVFLSLVE